MEGIGNFFLGADNTPEFELRKMKFDAPEPHEVLIRVMSCGICGTDVHIYKGGAGSAKVEPPVVLGHEFSGVVIETGSEVETIKLGDHVTLDPNMYCGKCLPCRMGRKQNCERLFALGVNVNGGFAQYCKCPDTQVYKVSEDISFDEAAMAEPLACVIHGIDQANIHAGQSVLVIGGGTIGLLMVQMAKLSGASRVVLSEPVAERRRVGLDIGADEAIDPINEDLYKRIKEITNSDGFNVVIECVGKTFAAEQAIASAGYGATILFFSVPDVEAKTSLPMFDVYKKELRIVGSMINPDTHQRAVNMINSGRLEIKRLVTHSYSLSDLEPAIKMQMSGESIKVVVHPNN